MEHVPYDKVQPILKHLEGLVYRDPPRQNGFEGGRTWKEHAIEGDEVISMIADSLEAAGCCHGHGDRGATPPMMYPEWIMCAVAQREKQIKELNAKLKVAQTIINTHNLCHDKHGKVDAEHFAESCAHEQRNEFGRAPHADALRDSITLLQKIEWITAIHDTAQCPYCNRQQHRGHTETCELKRLLDQHNAEADPGGTEESGKPPVQGAESSSE